MSPTPESKSAMEATEERDAKRHCGTPSETNPNISLKIKPENIREVVENGDVLIVIGSDQGDEKT